MASTFLSLRSATRCKTLAYAQTRCIATSARLLARAAVGKATKKYGKGAEPKKRKLSPEAEVKLQAQRSRERYEKNPHKMSLEEAINVIRVHAESNSYSQEQGPDSLII